MTTKDEQNPVSNDLKNSEYESLRAQIAARSEKQSTSAWQSQSAAVAILGLAFALELTEDSMLKVHMVVVPLIAMLVTVPSMHAIVNLGLSIVRTASFIRTKHERYTGGEAVYWESYLFELRQNNHDALFHATVGNFLNGFAVLHIAIIFSAWFLGSWPWALGCALVSLRSWYWVARARLAIDAIDAGSEVNNAKDDGSEVNNAENVPLLTLKTILDVLTTGPHLTELPSRTSTK